MLPVIETGIVLLDMYTEALQDITISGDNCRRCTLSYNSYREADSLIDDVNPKYFVVEA